MDINTTQVDVPVDGNVLTNDVDPEGDDLTVTTPIDPMGGTVVIDSAGNYTFTPAPGFTGEATFSYEVCDDGSPVQCDTAEVVIEVIDNTDPNNNPPIIEDNIVMENDTTVTGDLLSNDSDPDGDNLTITTSPIDSTDNGELTINPDGTYTYDPDPNFVGVDTFTYEVCDDGTPMAWYSTSNDRSIASRWHQRHLRYRRCKHRRRRRSTRWQCNRSMSQKAIM